MQNPKSGHNLCEEQQHKSVPRHVVAAKTHLLASIQLLVICPSFPIHHPFLANLAITTSTEKWKKERNRKKKKKKQGYMHCMAILSHTEQDLLD